MNRYFKSLGITLFFYILCGGMVIFCQTHSSIKEKPIVVEDSISIKVSGEPLPQPQVEIAPIIPSNEKPSVKAQKQKTKVASLKTLPSPVISEMGKEENLPLILPPKQEVMVAKQVDTQALHVKQASYFQQLKERINQHKMYPKIAQKRNLEGNVMVEFTISAKGELLSYAIINGQTLFAKSAEEAIVKSFPFPVEEELFIENQTIQIEILYSLI